MLSRFLSSGRISQAPKKKLFLAPQKHNFARTFCDNNSRNLFVGNLPWSASEADLQEFFSKYGTITSIKIMKDNQTGRSRGFGFITLTGDADRAIADLDGKDLKGRPLRVNEAKPPAPRMDRPPREDFGDRQSESRGDFGNRQDRPTRNFSFGGNDRSSDFGMGGGGGERKPRFGLDDTKL